MNPALHYSAEGCSRLTKDLPLNLVLVYEDHATGINAMRSINQLARRKGLPVELGPQNVWKFEVLASRALRNIAASEAANADMIIVAAHGAERLPIAVMHWLELWLSRRGTSPAALVALLDGATGDRSKPLLVETCLKRCARRGHMDFFVHTVGDRVDIDEEEPPPNAARSEETSATLEKILQGLRGSFP